MKELTTYLDEAFKLTQNSKMSYSIVHFDDKVTFSVTSSFGIFIPKDNLLETLDKVHKKAKTDNMFFVVCGGDCPDDEDPLVYAEKHFYELSDNQSIIENDTVYFHTHPHIDHSIRQPYMNINIYEKFVSIIKQTEKTYVYFGLYPNIVGTHDMHFAYDEKSDAIVLYI